MGLLANAAKAGAPRVARIARIRLVLAMNPKPRQNAAFVSVSSAVWAIASASIGEMFQLGAEGRQFKDANPTI